MPLDLRDRILTVTDFPAPGILFRDITPLLGDARALRQAVSEMLDPWRDTRVDLVTAMEARGFLFAAPVAFELDAGVVPVRKSGKLPRRTRSVPYKLEYRSDVLHIHEDAIRPGQQVLVVDDVLASGGTAAAVIELVEQLGGKVVGAQFLIELTDLVGRKLLRDYQVRSVIQY